MCDVYIPNARAHLAGLAERGSAYPRFGSGMSSAGPGADARKTDGSYSLRVCRWLRVARRACPAVCWDADAVDDSIRPFFMAAGSDLDRRKNLRMDQPKQIHFEQVFWM